MADGAVARARPAGLHRALLTRGGRSIDAAAHGTPTAWTTWDDLPTPVEDRVRAVLDGVLEVDWGAGPRTGAEAAPWFADGWAPPAPDGVLSERSYAALRSAPWLTTDDPAEFARWLYAFGRAPAVASEVRTGRAREALLRSFDRWRLDDVYAQAGDEAWAVYGLRSAGEGTRPPRRKLYVSPDRSSLDEAMRHVAELLLEAPVPAFKLARDRAGGGRPDKCVVYFHTADAFAPWAAQLAERLESASGHGVPFTCPLSTDHVVLSWAIDPLVATDAKPESWRSWCTDRLGWSLAVAQGADPARATMPPWAFALYRLGLDGVDVGRWRLAA